MVPGQSLKSNATDFSVLRPLHRRTGWLELDLGMLTQKQQWTGMACSNI